MKHLAIVGNIGHFDNEIDIAGLATVPGIERVNVKPQVDEWVFADGHSVIRSLRGSPAQPRQRDGHPSFVMSNSFTNQTIAQIEPLHQADSYEKTRLRAAKLLDEKVGAPALDALGIHLTQLVRAGRLHRRSARWALQERSLPLLVPAGRR